MTRPKCKDCAFFDVNGDLCRVNPPQSIAVSGAAPPVKVPGARPSVGFISWWPTVNPGRDYCGSFQDDIPLKFSALTGSSN